MRVSELEGAELNLWVARANGFKESQDDHGPILVGDDGFWIRPCGWMPSTDWAQGGPIIERAHINLTWMAGDTEGRETWMAVVDPDVTGRLYDFGETALIASMRAFVSQKYGDTVPVA